MTPLAKKAVQSLLAVKFQDRRIPGIKGLAEPHRTPLPAETHGFQQRGEHIQRRILTPRHWLVYRGIQDKVHPAKRIRQRHIRLVRKHFHGMVPHHRNGRISIPARLTEPNGLFRKVLTVLKKKEMSCFHTFLAYFTPLPHIRNYITQ